MNRALHFQEYVILYNFILNNNLIRHAYNNKSKKEKDSENKVEENKVC